MNNKNIISIFVVLAIVFTILGGTLAYWSWISSNADKTNVTFTVGSTFSCSADGGGNITNNSYFAPSSCTNSNYAIKREITTHITNNSSDTIYMDMWLNINSIGSGLSNSQNFKYALTTSSSSCTSNVITEGTFYGKVANDKIELLSQVSAGSTYYLYIWLDAAETSSDTQNQTISLSLGGTCTNEVISLPESNVLSERMAMHSVIDNTSSTYVTNSNGVQFNAISSDTNGKGIYMRNGTQNAEHPIYYYRGAVTDNNVLFANFCWKIVRTTDTGGVKLIYNGIPSNGECNNTGANSQLANTAKYNANGDSLSDLGYMYGTRYPYDSKVDSQLNHVYLYGGSVTYSNGNYTLTSTKSSSGTWSDDYNTLNNYHYTCFNNTGTCSTVSYIFYTEEDAAYYVTLSGGKTINDALSDMLTNSSNTNNSTIKSAVDAWYQSNMTSYTSYLEDTPFCNDRGISSLAGWKPNGGSVTSSYFTLKARSRSSSPSLACSNTNDAFTVSSENGNGKLTYPVGLLTADVAKLAGGASGANNTFYLYTGAEYHLMSPAGFDVLYESTIFSITSTGYFSWGNVITESGVRPVISLKPGATITSGDGTVSDPYVLVWD
ncbi:MAG: hypothetical protein IKI04_01610 [Bacilli bacterium]|nr:hypothetical protein [Bacilli bacterium]